MTRPIVVLTEEPLVPADVRSIASMHVGDDVAYTLLVPSDTTRSLFVDFFESLSMLHIVEAFRNLTGHRPPADEGRVAADETLSVSLRELRAAGLKADGSVTSENPVSALVHRVNAVGAGEAVVITRPHAIEDTFHTDWATQAQDELELPVLHLYAGSGYIGDS